MSGDVAVGFDFGTSNSAIAVVEPGERTPRLLRLDRANPESTLVPTLLYIERDGTSYLGQDAINAFVRLEAGRTTIRQQVAVEREIDTVFGREVVRFNIDAGQPGRFFQSLKSYLADRSYQGTDTFGQFRTLEDLIALFLAEMHRRAEEEIGQRGGEERDRLRLRRRHPRCDGDADRRRVARGSFDGRNPARRQHPR